MSWELKRLGKFTASEIGKLMKKGRSKDQYFGDGAITYIESRVAEIFTQEPVSNLEGLHSIEWGNTHEPMAAVEFSERMGGDLDYYGKSTPKFFAYEPFADRAGGSPDGIMPIKQAVVEFKCPSTATTHIKYWRMKTAADLLAENDIYYAQIQFNMMCIGYDLGYFASYDPRVQDNYVKLKILEIPRDKAYCQELHDRIGKAVDLVRKIIFEDIYPPIPVSDSDNVFPPLIG